MRLLLLTLFVWAAGCAAPTRERAADTPGEALLAVGGQPLVFTAPGLALAPAGPADASLAGRPVPAWIDHVALRPRATIGDRWRDAPPTWESVAPGSAGALTFVHVEIPHGAPGGELRVGGERRRLRVIASASPMSPPATRAEASLYHADDVSTNDYWRLRLSGVSGAGLADRHPVERAGALALAAQWDGALAQLERDSSWLARRVMLALTRTCDVGGTRTIAWLDDLATDDRLRRALLDDTGTSYERSETARAWLEAQPSMTVRVRDPASAGATAVQLTDLSGRPAKAYISNGRSAGAALLASAWGTIELPAPRAKERSEILIASAGSRAIELTAPEAHIVAQPPGARLAPLVPDLNMRDWLGRTVAPVERATAAAALVQRRAHANEWELYVECKSPVTEPHDALRIWLGPRGGATEILTVDRDGTLASDRAGSTGSLVAHEVRDDRWSATIALPAGAIAPDGTLLIGLTRELGAGARARRWAWPVALLPWEEDPGRVSVILTDWYRLSR